MAKQSARYTKRYADSEKQAFLRAVLVDQMTVSEAVRAGAAGELGVPAFELNRIYGYQLIKRHRDEYEIEHGDAMALAIDTAMTRLASKTLRLARETLKDDKATVNETRSAMLALKTAREGLSKAKPAAQAAPEPKPTLETDKPDVIGRLLDQTTNGARGPVHSSAR
jgi:hypothetical protein